MTPNTSIRGHVLVYPFYFLINQEFSQHTKNASHFCQKRKCEKCDIKSKKCEALHIFVKPKNVTNVMSICP